MKVKLSDIIDAIEMMDQYSEYFLDKETGEIEWVSDMTMTQDEKEEIYDKLDEHGFYRLPTSFDIRDYDIMADFVNTLSGTAHERLASAIQGKGAFRRFKDAVIRMGIDKDWYDYQASVYKRIAAEWCEGMGLTMSDENKKVYGYVYYIRAYSTSENPTYNAGTIAVWYGGTRGTLLGNDGFEPYKSEESAKRGRSSWEKRFALIDNPGNGWKHQVGGVLPVTEEMYTEMEEQRQKHFEIVSQKPNPMMERLLESIKREGRRMNFKVIK